MANKTVEASVLAQCPSLYPSSFVKCVSEGVNWLAKHHTFPNYETTVSVNTSGTVTSDSESLVRIGLIDIDRPMQGLTYYEVLNVAETVDSVNSNTIFKVRMKYKTPLGIEITLRPIKHYNVDLNTDDYYLSSEVDEKVAELQSAIDELKAAIENISTGSVDLSNYYTKEEIDALLNGSSDSEDSSGDSDSVPAGSMESQINVEALVALISAKADKTDLDNYYTKEEIDSKFEELSTSDAEDAEESGSDNEGSVEAGVVDSQINYEALVAILEKKANVDDVYTKEEIDNGKAELEANALATFALKSDVYTKSEVDAGRSELEAAALETFAAKSDVYTKDEVDALIEDVKCACESGSTDEEDQEGDTSSDEYTVTPLEPVTITSKDEPTTINLDLSEEYTVDINVTNEEVASVTYENGVLTIIGLSNGTTTATIIAKKEGENDDVYTVVITVELAESGSESTTPGEMTPEVKTITLTSIEEPYVMELNVGEGYELSVSTGNQEVATAEYKDGSIVVTAVANGETTLDILVKKDDEEDQTISLKVVVELTEGGNDPETPDPSDPDDDEEGDEEDSSTPAEGMEPQEAVITLTSKDEPYTMNLNIGEGYSVSASTENEEVATVAVDGGNITVSAVADGETVLNIVVSKEGEEPVSQSIKVVVALEEVSGGGEEPVEPVEPVEKELTGIEVTTMPSKVEYYLNESFDATGMVVTALYSDSTSEEISDYTVSPETFEEEGEINVTISYGNFTTSITVTVMDSAVDPGFGVDTPSIEKVSMSVKTQPNKTEYFVGESFDSTGMVLEITYSDDSTAEVINGFTVEPSVFEEAGDEIAVTITYEDITTTLNVKVVEVVVESLEVTAPNKVEYYVGDTLDTEGLVVVAKYNNGNTEEVQDYELSVDMSQAGEEVPVTVTYKEVSATFNIKINEVVAESMSIATEPTKVAYFIGDTVDLSGLVLKISYNNGSEELITEGYTYDAITLESEGNHVITVTYGEFTVEVTVVAYEPTLESLTIKTDPDKTEYFVGDSIDYTGLVVEGSFSNGKTVEMEEYNVSPEVFTEAGEIEVVVSVGEISTSFKVNVTAVVMTSIGVTNSMSQLLYYVGDSINTDGLEVTAYYNNGSEVVLSSEQYEISPVQFDTAGDVEITVTVGEFTTKFSVEVLEVVLQSISVTTRPTSLQYIIGETLDTTGMVVTGYYNNGTSAIIPEGEYTVDTTVLETAGDDVLFTISVGDITTQTGVTVYDVTSLEVTTNPDKMEYYLNESFDPTGMVITGTFENENNTFTSQKVLTNYTYTPETFAEAGEQTVTISYYNASVQLTVQVTLAVQMS